MKYRIVERTIKDDGIWFYPQRQYTIDWHYIRIYMGTKPYCMFWKEDVYNTVRFQTKEDAVKFMDVYFKQTAPADIIHDYP